MKTIDLKPLISKDQDSEEIERELIKKLKEEIYLPLLELFNINKSIVKNSLMDVVDAIRSGAIYYSNGRFYGKFNSAISKELKKAGAIFKDNSFIIPYTKVPTDMKFAISYAEDKYKEKLKKMDQKVDEILTKDIDTNIEKQYVKIISNKEKDFQKSVKAITIPPNLTDEMKQKIATEYTNNMNKYIKGWKEKEIIALRDKIKERSLAGLRSQGIVDEIQKSYGVSKNKAKFLARQETSLMTAKFTEARFTDAGIKKYRWQNSAGSANHPVRPMHRALNGKIFSWNDPPITDEKGNRNNPGEDFNCRCVAIPVVTF